MAFVQKLTQWFATVRSGLNSDVSPDAIANSGLFLTIPESGALNVRAVGDETNVSFDYHPIKGDLFINGFAAPTVQNRIYRIYISSASAGDYTFDFKDANGTLITSTGTIAVTFGNLATTYADLIDATPASGGIQDVLDTAGQTYNLGALVTTATDEGYFTLEITTVSYWDYEVANNDPIFSITNRIAVFVIIQEAVDPSMVGYWREIGSDSRVGDLFQFWTTRTELPSTIDIDTTTNSGGLYLVTTLTDHNLVQNQSVDISGNTSTGADGTWIINVLSTTTFELLGSTFVGNGTGGTVTTDIFGYGQITVSVKDENDQTWQGTVLLRSKEFNFSTKKQIDCRFKRKQDLNIAGYFTDDYNNYRVFYYKGAYITDGGLAINGGKYAYGTIADEILLDVQSLGFDIFFDRQIQSGGNLLSGNWRYAVRFGTEKYSFTNWGLLINPVCVTADSEQALGDQFFGRPSGTPTPKQNVLRITNPEPGIFLYAEIAAINYLDGGYSGFIIGRYVLTGASTQYITHTGFELGSTDLDIGTLNNLSLAVAHGRNIELLNNRLIKSNLTLAPTVDLSEFFESFEFSIERYALTTNSVGSFIVNGLAVGEYMLTDNVNHYVGYMLNERYRFGFMAEMKGGGFSPVFWSRDIIINTDNTQSGCTTALPDFDLTGGVIGVQFPYSFFIRWGGYNLDMQINGVRVRDMVKRIYCMRCEVVNPQVLAMGFLIPAVSDFVATAAPGGVTWVDPLNPATTGQLGEWVFPAGINEPTIAIPNVDYLYGAASGGLADFTYERSYCSFYAPDMFMGHTQITPQANDVVINFGQPTVQRSGYAEPIPPWSYDYYLEANGENQTPENVTIDQGANIAKGSSATLNGNLYSKTLMVEATAVFYGFTAPSGLALWSSGGTFNPINGVTLNPDVGIYNAQYFRAITDPDTQYGLKSDSKYIWTGTFLDIDDATPTTFSVFGGDVFNQKSYLKNRYPSVTTPNPIGFGQGISFYSLNRVNFQMRNPNAGSGTPTAFPASGTNNSDHVQVWLNNINLESLSYNEGYTIRNEITQYAAFDTNAEYQIDWRNVIWWSQPESEGSVTDALRLFLPLDIKFEDYTYGYITDFRNENEEAIVVQQRKTIREYFNSNAVLTTKEGSEVITGDGGVMNQKGLTVSRFGSSNKWSIVQGKNTRGNDVLYGIDTDNKCIWRYGYDGESNLSEIQQIASFCKNNFQFVIGKDNPADEQGICAFANQKFREVGWTLRGWKSGVAEWTQPTFHMEHLFDSVDGNGAYGDLLNVNGVLYGTTQFGGATNAGIIFSYDPSTDTFTNLFEFTFGSVAQGYSPIAGLVYANSLLYGITPFGGANAVGTIFSIALDGTGFTNEFDMAVATGATGIGELIEFGGNLYGMASAGGANTFGVLFKFNYNTNTYTDIIDFTGTAGGFKGATPQGKLYTDGTYLYGLTRTGGANNVGVLFQYDLTTYTVLHEFATATGSLPMDSLTESGNKLYGTTSAGGTGTTGTLFEFNLLTLTHTVLHDFIVGSGTEPLSTPTVYGSKIYGTTRLDGAVNLGTLWQYDLVLNLFTKIYDFNTPDIFPRGQMVLINNTLYGASVGTTLVNYGTIYSYSLDGYYNIGDIVQFGTTSFEQVPAFYESLIDNNVFNPPDSVDPATWQLIPTTDNRVYSFYTIVYSELKDIFQLFMSPKPNVYFQYKSTYGSCRPVDDTGSNYIADEGNLLEWYNNGSDSLIAPSYFDAVFNAPQNIRKTASAIRCISDIAPDRIEVRSKDQYTYMNPSDIETREGEHDAPIMNDATVTTVGLNGSVANPTGINNIDTSKIYGYYFITRLIMTQYNKVSSLILKVRWRSRLPQK